MELSSLKFVVDTSSLKDAADKLAELGTAVSKLNKPMQDLSNNTTKVSTATEKAAKAAETKAKADTKVVDTSSKLDGLLDKLTNRYTDMAKGSTSAEAGVLQLARSLGATTDSALKPYKDILENIRELSKSPFDSAIGSIRSITQEYDSLTYRAELASKGIFLTTVQLKEYSRIANEIKGKLKAADLDPTKGEGLAKFNSELKVQQDLYLGVANKVNTLKTAEKDRNDLLNTQMKESVRLQEASDNLFKYNLIRHKQDQDGYKQDMVEMRKYYSALEKESKPTAQSAPARMDAAVDAYRQNQARVTNEAAKANAYLSAEMERVNRLSAEGNSIGSATNNRLIRFEQELKKSGQTAEVQASKLAIYRKELLATQKAAGNRQVDYLSRALGPQITDIFVGLYSGQSPMTVLVQQGGQLRDQFALAGVAGSQMGDMLVKAAGNMITSIKDVGAAIGQVFIKMIEGVGQRVMNFGMNITGTSTALNFLRSNLVSMVGENAAVVKSFDSIGKSMGKIVGTGVFAVIATIVALGVEYVKVANAEKELTKSLAMSGAALGMSTEDAIKYATAMNSVGIGTMDAMRMIGEFANAGADAGIPLDEIIKSAQDMQKYVGIATADTMKSFADISEKPVEGLIKLAKSTGSVTAATILQAEAFVKAGKNAEAAALAQKSLRESNDEVTSRMKNNLDPLQRLWLDIKNGISQVGESLYNLLKSDVVVATFRTAWELVAVTVTEVWYVLKQTGNEIAGIASQIKAVMSGDFKGAADIGKQMQENAKIARSEQDKLTASILNRNNAEKETLKVTETQRKANRADAKAIEDRIKAAKAPKTDEQKEAIKQEKEFSDLLESANRFYQDQISAVNELTKSEIALSKVKEGENYKSKSAVQKKEIDDIYNKAKANEILKRTEDERRRDIALVADLYGKNDNMGDQYYSTLRKLDDALLSGNVNLEEYGRLLNIVYKTSSSFKSLESVGSSVGKNIADIDAARQEIASQYGMDFKTEDEKANMTALSKFKIDTLKSDADMEKKVADAKKTMNSADHAAAVQLYTGENAIQKKLLEERLAREQYVLTDSYKRNKAYSSAFEDMFKGMGDALVDFALTGKTSFSEMVNSMIVGLIKLEMQMAMTNMYKSAGGMSGILGSIGSAFMGSPGSTSTLSAGSADMSMFAANGAAFGTNSIQAFAKGGSFTNSVVSEPTLFKFAKGTGMMGEAGPEAIMPLRRGSDGSLGVVAAGGSSGNVSVNVINNSSSQATTSETTDSKGNRRIEVVIGDMTAGEISRSGSASQKSIKSTFGLQPQLIRR